MYCKHCGKETNKEGLYCTNCGTLLEDNSENLNKKAEKIKYCNNCGAEAFGNYCPNCGTQVNRYILKNISVSKVLGNTDILDVKKIVTSIKSFSFKDAIQNVMDKIFIKELLIHTGTAFIIGLILCLLINMVLFSSFNEEAKAFITEIKGEIPNADIRLTIDAFDIYGFSFPNTYKINYSGMLGFQDNVKDAMTLKITLSLLILLLIPILSFLGAGFKKYKSQSTTKENMKLYIYSSALYSILLNIIFLFNHKGLKLSTDVFGKIEINIKAGFSFFGSLITIFIISFIVQMMLSIFMKKERFIDVLSHLVSKDKIAAFTNVIKLGFIYSIVLFIMFGLLGFMGILGPVIQELCKMPAVLLFIPNIIIYIYQFLFGNSFNIMVGQEVIKHGIINSTFRSVLFNNVGKVYGLAIMNIFIVIGTAVIIYIAVKKLPKENYFKHLAVFSGMIAVFNFVLALYSRLQMNVKGNLETLENILELFDIYLPISFQGKLYVGTSLFMSFIVSYIFVFLIGVARYYLGEKKQSLVVENFVKSYKKQTLIAVPIVLFLISLLSFKIALNDGITKNTYLGYKESSYDNYLNNKNIHMIGNEEIESLYLVGDNSYLINTFNEVYLFDFKKDKITKLFSTGESLITVLPSCDYEKIAILYGSENDRNIKIIDMAGTEIIDKKGIEYTFDIRWSPDSKMLLIESSSNSIVNLATKEIEVLDVPGNHLEWKDNNNFVYLNEGQVYEYDMKKKESVPLDKKAREIIRKGDKVFIISEVVNEDGVLQSEYIEELNGEIKIEFEGSIFNFDIINNGNICTIFGKPNDLSESNEYVLLIKKKGDNGYENIDHNIRFICDTNYKTNQMIVTREGTWDYFQVNLEKGIWNNITLELISLQRLMEEGEK